MTATEEHQAAREPRNLPAHAAAEELARERDFLLASLADLDAEHRAGELSSEQFVELRDRYTVQTAAVLRALERLSTEARSAPPESRPRSRRVLRRSAAVAAVAAVVALGGFLLSRSVAEREAGQTITGNAQTIIPPADLDALARAARDRPGDAAAQVAYASALLEAGRTVEALRAFDTAARLDPADPMPKAYGGWIVALAGLTDEALVRLDAAVAADPTYPDARFFRGMTLLRGRNDRAGALAELREYLRLAPAGPERDQVQSVVDELEASDPAAS